MLIQILLAIFAGTFTGVLTGLIPGIHVNLIGVFLISLSSTLLFNINPLYLVIFIVAIAITHIFIDFIPSIFLGCPDTDTELSVLSLVFSKNLYADEKYNPIYFNCSFRNSYFNGKK
ncbi:tripartite tricarboxylate transporter permease [Candidatus Pacearchaeota archaeon]|nr:tripartite tricarboxylate transporter permease [Candidatus Pacearchaeota archaeon]